MISRYLDVSFAKIRRNRQRVHWFFVPFSACWLFGCAQTQLEHHSNALNRASAVTMSEQVLLNAVRASLDLPMSFTKLTKYTTENMAKGSFAPKIPFGLAASAIASYDVGATANWSSGVSQVEYADVNTASALTNLNKNLGYEAVDRYLGEGMSLALMGTLLVQYAEVHHKLATEIKEQAKSECSSKPGNGLCRELDQIHDDRPCPDANNWREKPLWFRDEAVVENDQKFYVVANNASTLCDFVTFQSLRLMLRLSGYTSDLVPGKPDLVIAETPEKRLVALPKEAKPVQGVRFQMKKVQQTYVGVEKNLAKNKNSHRKPIRIALRSPRGLLTYLGELIALQNYSETMWLPEIVLNEEGKRLVIFRVKHGNPGLDPTALTITGPYGDAYYVPRRDYGSEDQTLRVLSIATELINGAISEKDFPAPAAVTVRAIQ